MEKWSSKMLDEVIELLRQGKTYEEIGLLYDKSYNSIRSKLFKFNVKTSDFVDFEKNKIKNCLECGEQITGYKKFCNSSCAAIYNNKNRIKKEKKYCLNCSKEIPNRNIYCCNDCKWEYEKKEFIRKWKNNEVCGMSGKLSISEYIREYIFQKYENKCARCGWNEINPYTNKIPLQVEHIDGNYMNNKEENLILLCPSCHSLTPTYGSRNRGNGRPR